jgi:hypothetical protein
MLLLTEGQIFGMARLVSPHEEDIIIEPFEGCALTIAICAIQELA